MALKLATTWVRLHITAFVDDPKGWDTCFLHIQNEKIQRMPFYSLSQFTIGGHTSRRDIVIATSFSAHLFVCPSLSPLSLKQHMPNSDQQCIFPWPRSSLLQISDLYSIKWRITVMYIKFMPAMHNVFWNGPENEWPYMTYIIKVSRSNYINDFITVAITHERVIIN